MTAAHDLHWHQAGVFDWLQVFRGLSLPPAVKCTGYALATFADWDTGRNAHPGAELLMLATGYNSRQTIVSATAELRRLRLVQRKTEGRRAGRRQLADMYWLTFTNDLRIAALLDPCRCGETPEAPAAAPDPWSVPASF